MGLQQHTVSGDMISTIPSPTWLLQEIEMYTPGLPIPCCELDLTTGDLCMMGTRDGAMQLHDFRIGKALPE